MVHMPGHRAAPPRTTLRERREAAGVSARQLARTLKVSHPTVLRWEEADDAPVRKREAINLALAAELGRRSRMAAEVVEAEGRVPLTELRRRLGASGDDAIADALAEGRLLEVEDVSVDAQGRRYVRNYVVAKRGHLSTRALGLSHPSADGAELRRNRQALGISSKDFATRLGIPPSLLRLWETGHRPVPRARTRELQEALYPSGAEISRLRKAAGWTLKDFGSQVGVGVPTVDAWEAGRRRVPPARVAAVRAALLDCQQAATVEQRVERILDEIVKKLAKSPGMMRSEVLHHRQPRELWQRAINEGLRRGTVIEVELPPEFSGRLRTVTALYRAEDAPELPATSSLSGADLRRGRKSLGLTMRQLGDLVGVPVWTVQSWEKRGTRSIPLRSVEPVRRAIDSASPLEQRNRRAVLELISAQAGMAKSTVPRKLHGALASLLDSGAVRLATTWDSLGRPYKGLFMTGAVVPRRESMTAEELAGRREGAGASQQELADRVRVRASAVSRWESGVRGIPPARVATIRSALDELAANARPGRRLRGPRTEPGPDVPESARALRRRRISAGLSQVDLARMLGVSSVAVSHWERAGVPLVRAVALDAALPR